MGRDATALTCDSPARRGLRQVRNAAAALRRPGDAPVAARSGTRQRATAQFRQTVARARGICGIARQPLSLAGKPSVAT